MNWGEFLIGLGVAAIIGIPVNLLLWYIAKKKGGK